MPAPLPSNYGPNNTTENDEMVLKIMESIVADQILSVGDDHKPAWKRDREAWRGDDDSNDGNNIMPKPMNLNGIF